MRTRLMKVLNRLRPRSRWLRLVLAGLALIALAVTFAVRQPAPIGHWDSADGQDRFLRAYREAFAALPDPAETIDVRTDFGIVRVYRFAATAAGAEGGGANAPLLLLPGRASPPRSGPTTCPCCCRSATSTPSTCSASRA